MRAVRSQTNEDISDADGWSRKKVSTFDNPHQCSCDIKSPIGIDARHLGGLPTQDHASGNPARVRHAFDNLGDTRGVKPR